MIVIYHNRRVCSACTTETSLCLLHLLIARLGEMMPLIRRSWALLPACLLQPPPSLDDGARFAVRL